MKTKLMTKKQALALIGDLKIVAMRWQWCIQESRHPNGFREAQDLIDAIHRGKLGARYGLWPQIDEAIKILSR